MNYRDKEGILKTRKEIQEELDRVLQWNKDDHGNNLWIAQAYAFQKCLNRINKIIDGREPTFDNIPQLVR